MYPTPDATTKKKEERGQRLSRYSKLRRFQMEKIPRFYFLSCIAKAFEFISSQSTFHLVGLNELSKNQKFALNLLNQLTTKSWE